MVPSEETADAQSLRQVSAALMKDVRVEFQTYSRYNEEAIKSALPSLFSPASSGGGIGVFSGRVAAHAVFQSMVSSVEIVCKNISEVHCRCKFRAIWFACSAISARPPAA